jgi:hypothetical protein
MEDPTKETIKREYESGEIDYLQAIEALENIGLSGRDAEKLVDSWDHAGNFLAGRLYRLTTVCGLCGRPKTQCHPACSETYDRE